METIAGHKGNITGYKASLALLTEEKGKIKSHRGLYTRLTLRLDEHHCNNAEKDAYCRYKTLTNNGSEAQDFKLKSGLWRRGSRRPHELHWSKATQFQLWCLWYKHGGFVILSDYEAEISQQWVMCELCQEKGVI